MSAVAQRARLAGPATLRSQSVGRRSAGQRHAHPALRRRPTPGRQAGEVAAEPARQPGGGTRRRRGRRPTARVHARQPALRAAAGPAPPAARTTTPRPGAGRHVERPARPGRSSTTTTRWAAARRRRERGEQPPSEAPPDGRDDDVVGSRTAHATSSGARRQRGGRAGRRTTNGPIASRSTGAEPKHSSASRGSSTIGRPAVLRRVLTTTGTPVRASNALEHRAPPAARRRGRRSGCARCRRRARRPGCGRASSVRTSCTNSMYGLGSGPAKISARALGEHHRRDRPELLAALDVVEPLEVLAPAAGRRAASGARAPAGRTRCGPGTRRRRRRRPAPRRPRRRRRRGRS